MLNYNMLWEFVKIMFGFSNKFEKDSLYVYFRFEGQNILLYILKFLTLF
jgi:hypothetical protein